MKVHSDNKSKFRQFNLTFVIESEEDARAIYCLFNYSPICGALNSEFGINTQDIRTNIEKEYPDIKYDYNDAFDALVERIERNIEGCRY